MGVMLRALLTSPTKVNSAAARVVCQSQKHRNIHRRNYEHGKCRICGEGGGVINTDGDDADESDGGDDYHGSGVASETVRPVSNDKEDEDSSSRGSGSSSRQ